MSGSRFRAMAVVATTLMLSLPSWVHAAAPVFTQYSDMAIGEGLLAQQTVRAVDTDVDNLTFFKVSGPDYMTVQTLNFYGLYAFAEVTIKPPDEEAGTTVAVLGVTDGVNVTTVDIRIDVLATCPRVSGLIHSLPWTPSKAVLGDVNGDGNVDVVTFSSSTLDATVMHGLGNGGFGNEIPFTTSASGAALADVNEDGRDDIVSKTYDHLQIALADNVGGFGPAVDLPSDGSYASTGEVAVADLNRDGHLDLILAYLYPAHLRVFLGDGQAGFSVGSSSDVPGTIAYGPLATADFDGDGILDVALSLYYAQNLLVFRGDGAGGLGPAVSYPLPQYGGSHGLAAGDLNGDGRPDLAVAHDGLTVLFNDGQGHFPAFRSLVASYRFWSVTIADVTGDGRTDVLATGEEWFDQTGGAMLVFRGTASEVLGAPTGTLFGGRLEGVATSDFDGDGRLDWVVTDPSYTVATWLNRGCDELCLPTVVSLDVTPNALNLSSLGHWVSATLEPEPPASPSEIDLESIRLNETVHVDGSAPTVIGDADGDGRPDLTVRFDRRAVGATLAEGEAVTVTVKGKIGTSCFEARDVVRALRAHIVSPDAGTLLQAGSRTEVRWVTPIGAQVQWAALLWSTDDGTTWTIDTNHLPNSGNCSWTVPDVSTAQARVAVVLVESVTPTTDEVEGVLAVSDPFTISSSVVSVEGITPHLALQGALPNPGAGLRVGFHLPGSEPAKLTVYDIGGREVCSRDVGALGAGQHWVVLRAPGTLATGVYIVQLAQGNRRLIARAVVVR